MPQTTDALSLFAIAAPGLEPLVAAELGALGITAAVEPGGVSFTGGADTLYAANLRLRTASRVLVRVAEFRATTFFELEKRAGRLPWERFVGAGQPVRFRVTCRKSRLYHSDAVAERLYGVVEARAGGRPVVAGADAEPQGGEAGEDAEGADAQLFVVRFLNDRCTISADGSGALLHLRGYRQAVAKAPLRETLAAAMLLGSGWDGRTPLVDPLCGSGTIPIEAALLARRIAPGLVTPASAGEATRRFAFQQWPEFDARRWAAVVERARAEVLPRAPVPIVGSDRDAGAIGAAGANAARAGVTADVELRVRAVSAIEPPAGPGTLIANPPYGVRVGEGGAKDVRDLYAQLGKVAHRKCPGWTLVLLSPDRRLEGQLRVPLEERLRTSNGGIPVRLVAGTVPAGD